MTKGSKGSIIEKALRAISSIGGMAVYEEHHLTPPEAEHTYVIEGREAERLFKEPIDELNKIIDEEGVEALKTRFDALSDEEKESIVFNKSVGEAVSIFKAFDNFRRHLCDPETENDKDTLLAINRDMVLGNFLKGKNKLIAQQQEQIEGLQIEIDNLKQKLSSIGNPNLGKQVREAANEFAIKMTDPMKEALHRGLYSGQKIADYFNWKGIQTAENKKFYASTIINLKKRQIELGIFKEEHFKKKKNYYPPLKDHP